MQIPAGLFHTKFYEQKQLGPRVSVLNWARFRLGICLCRKFRIQVKVLESTSSTTAGRTRTASCAALVL